MFAKQQSILSQHQRDRVVANPTTSDTRADARSPALAESSRVPVPGVPSGTNAQRAEPAPATAGANASTTSPTAPASESEGSRLIVGPDVKLKGAEIQDCDTLIVEGSVEATMDSRVIRICESGAFNGKVGIDIAEIHGNFEGELIARQQLIIHSTGRVRGHIRYGQVLIESGGVLSGDIQSLSEGNGASHGKPIERNNASGKPALSTVPPEALLSHAG